ncbi:MAG: Hpt domain-containing protein [Lentisphaeria bacterium]|jgi:HPt (histidine-containing phosphotransfer) domain-containing protein
MNRLQQQIRDHLVGAYGFDAETVAHLLGAAIQNVKEIVLALDAATAQGDWATVDHKGHSLKGVALNVGLTELGGLGKEIELAAKDSAAAAQTVPPLLARIQALARGLEQE